MYTIKRSKVRISPTPLVELNNNNNSEIKSIVPFRQDKFSDSLSFQI